MIRTKGTLSERETNKLFNDTRFAADDEVTADMWSKKHKVPNCFFDKLKHKGLRISAHVHCTAGSTVILKHCITWPALEFTVHKKHFMYSFKLEILSLLHFSIFGIIAFFSRPNCPPLSRKRHTLQKCECCRNGSIILVRSDCAKHNDGWNNDELHAGVGWFIPRFRLLWVIISTVCERLLVRACFHIIFFCFSQILSPSLSN